MKTQTQNYAPAVEKALKEYNKNIHSALEAVQKLESIVITARLSKMFGVEEQKAAKMIQKDYLIAV